jgi:ATP-dependent RNA helicase DDX19/DBP5
MIGQSQSGTGKTAAFVLTMLSRVDFTQNHPQAICLAPSRELARQIMSVVVAMGKFTPVQTEYAIKDHLPREASRVSAHVIVGTPGTMTDLLRRKVIDPTGIKVFVLDEADNMLDQDGLGDQTLRVKKYYAPPASYAPRRSRVPQPASEGPGRTADPVVQRDVPGPRASIRGKVCA